MVANDAPYWCVLVRICAFGVLDDHATPQLGTLDTGRHRTGQVRNQHLARSWDP